MDAMRYLVATLAVAVSYLSGSVLYAVVVTRLVTGKDIRKQGNLNPGTSNVARTVGKGWGVLVCALDSLKAIVPMLAARLWLFKGDDGASLAFVYAVGMAAVVGHCRPIFYGFKGGGGIGTMLGVSLFMIPVEFAFSLLAGGVVAITAFRHTEHKYAQWTPIMFVILTPFVTLATTLLVDLPLFAHVSIGGHPWPVVACAFAMSLSLLWFNGSFMRNRAAEYQGLKGE